MERAIPRRVLEICVVGMAAGCSRPAPPGARPVAARPQVARVAGAEASQPHELTVTTLEAGKSYENADLKDVDVSGLVLSLAVDRFLAGALLDGSKLSTVKWQVGRRAFYGTHLARTDLSNADVVCGDSAFQKSCFDDSQMPGATLTGGGASFQFATFDGANLAHARLAGSGSSFQMASFENANLQGAVLKAAGAAFQAASFKNANLVDATVSCADLTDFQGAKLDGAHFQHADLSSIDPSSLSACEFASSAPPYYDAATRFPAGFDPVKAGWANADRL